jgi:predicted RNase H-like HicB family nuclease
MAVHRLYREISRASSSSRRAGPPTGGGERKEQGPDPYAEAAVAVGDGCCPVEFRALSLEFQRSFRLGGHRWLEYNPVKEVGRMIYRIALRTSEEGYSASVPGLPGCWSQGATEAEALENIREAIREYLAVAAELTQGAEIREVDVAVRGVQGASLALSFPPPRTLACWMRAERPRPSPDCLPPSIGYRLRSARRFRIRHSPFGSLFLEAPHAFWYK